MPARVVLPLMTRHWTDLPRRLTRRAARLCSRSNGRLFIELVRANVKTSDYNSVLGIFWSLLGPLVMLAGLYAVFQRRFGHEVQAYPLYLLLGIVVVSFFLTVTRFLINIFFAHKQLLLNSTVPRETLVASHLAVHVYKFSIELLLCAAFSVYYGLFSWRSAVWIVPLLVSYVALVAGVGLIFALVYCFARDVEHIWGMASRLLFFVTPVFYDFGSLSPAVRFWIYWANPLTPFLLAFRNAFTSGGPVDVGVYVHSTLLGMGILLAGYCAFLLLESLAVERA